MDSGEDDVVRVTAPVPARPPGPWAVNVTLHGVGAPPRPMEDDDEAEVWVSVEQLERILDTAVGRPEVTVTLCPKTPLFLTVSTTLAAAPSPESLPVSPTWPPLSP